MIVKTTPTDSAAPERSDSEAWPYAAVALTGETYFADSVTEIIEATLPGYTELKHTDDEGNAEFFDAGDDLALVLRRDDLISYATGLQQEIIRIEVEDHGFDLTSMSEDQLTALMAERLVPFEGIDMTVEGGTLVSDLDWTVEVPLVLLTSDYVPFTERDLPTGNIIWLDPTTELTYLRSLDSIGVLKLLVAE